MAQRRMFTKQITESDAFLEMPLSAQCLYFHLGMEADDEGFVGNPKKIIRAIGCQTDDFKLLIAKRFILTFDSGVVVIKHWLMHNTIRMDRFHPTDYTEERKGLFIKENAAYTRDGNQMATKWQPKSDKLATEVKLSKVNLNNKGYKKFMEAKKQIGKPI